MAEQTITKYRVPDTAYPKEQRHVPAAGESSALIRYAPPTTVVPVTVVAIAAWVGSVGMGLSNIVATAVGAAIVIAGLSRVGGTTMPEFVAKRVSFQWRKLRGQAPVTRPLFDAPTPDGGSCGVCWDDDVLITMIRVDGRPCTVTRLSPESVDAEEFVPLEEVVNCVAQFGPRLDSLDVISLSARTAGRGPVPQLYEQILGPLPATAYRTVWLVLRMDPTANVAATVDRRGSGSVDAVRSAATVTRRFVNRLAGCGLTATTLSAAEMDAATAQLTNRIPLDEVVENWNHVEHNDLRVISYAADSRVLNSAAMAAIWSLPALSTAVTLRLRAIPGRNGDIEVAGSVRLVTRRDIHDPAKKATSALAGLKPMAGIQHRAMLAFLPMGSRQPNPLTAFQLVRAESLGVLRLPLTGCGQLVGADSQGRGVAVALFGPAIRRVDVVGSIELAQQLVLRALALGAHIVVHTAHFGTWHPLVDRVGSPSALAIAARSPFLTQISAESIDLAVYDGDLAPAAVNSRATIMRVLPFGTDADGAADVTVTQDPGARNTVVVRTPGATVVVKIVSTPNELAYLPTAPFSPAS